MFMDKFRKAVKEVSLRTWRLQFGVYERIAGGTRRRPQISI